MEQPRRKSRVYLERTLPLGSLRRCRLGSELRGLMNRERCVVLRLGSHAGENRHEGCDHNAAVQHAVRTVVTPSIYVCVRLAANFAALLQH